MEGDIGFGLCVLGAGLSMIGLRASFLFLFSRIGRCGASLYILFSMSEGPRGHLVTSSGPPSHAPACHWNQLPGPLLGLFHTPQPLTEAPWTFPLPDLGSRGRFEEID